MLEHLNQGDAGLGNAGPGTPELCGRPGTGDDMATVFGRDHMRGGPTSEGQSAGKDACGTTMVAFKTSRARAAEPLRQEGLVGVMVEGRIVAARVARTTMGRTQTHRGNQGFRLGTRAMVNVVDRRCYGGWAGSAVPEAGRRGRAGVEAEADAAECLNAAGSGRGDRRRRRCSCPAGRGVGRLRSRGGAARWWRMPSGARWTIW